MRVPSNVHDTPAIRALTSLCADKGLDSSVAYSWVAYARAALHPNSGIVAMSPSPDVDTLWHHLLLNTSSNHLVCAELFHGATPAHSTRTSCDDDQSKIRRMANALTFIHALTGVEPPFLRNWEIPGYALRCIRVTRDHQVGSSGSRTAEAAAKRHKRDPHVQLAVIARVYVYDGVSRPSDVRDLLDAVFGIPSDAVVVDPEAVPVDEPIAPIVGAKMAIGVRSGPNESRAVFVRTLSGQTKSFIVDADVTVNDLKLRIRDTEGIPATQQRLIFCGGQLRGNDRLVAEREATLHLAVRMTGC